ncbi:MAG: hypothetical protein JSU81_06160 [Candidatus Coatesbacteria bacterium]|nr:MAG: hypothetical protein JSU81_06160 [Candidatus Coatesbacteria bacterium]
MRTYFKFSLLVAAAALASAAFALEPPALSGLIYTHFGYDLSSAEAGELEGGSEFGLGRCYVTAKGSVHESVSYEVTADVGRDSYTYYTYEPEFDPVTGEVIGLIETAHTQTGKLGFFLKYGYFDVSDLIPSHNLHAGLIKPPFAGYEHSLWGWRVIRRSAFFERGYGDTADLGVGVAGGFADGLIQHDFAVLNGGSVGSAEDPYSGKDVEYRLSVFPLVGDDDWAGLSVNAVAKRENLGEKVPAGAPKNPVTIYGGLLGLKHAFTNFGAGYYLRTAGEGATKYDGNVMSVFATVHLRATEGMTVHPIARYDMVEPNADMDDDERTLLIGGVGFKFFAGKLALIPNYQTEAYKERDPLTGATEDKSTDYAYLHCQFNWP